MQNEILMFDANNTVVLNTDQSIDFQRDEVEGSTNEFIVFIAYEEGLFN